MKNIRNFICAGLILVLCIGTASCSKNNADYSFEYKDGQPCIVFDNISKYNDTGTFETMEYIGITFTSVKEFKKAVTEGGLTDIQKSHVARLFSKDDKGNVLTCDFNKLYTPILPTGTSSGSVTWTGEIYSFGINSGDKIFGYVKCSAENRYKEIFDMEYTTFFDRDNINVSKTENLGGEKVVTYFYTSRATLKKIRYKLDVDGKTIFVDKEYILSHVDPKETVSETVPRYISLYCDESNNKCWNAWLYGFTEDPTDEWLMQFGLAPYVETDEESE